MLQCLLITQGAAAGGGGGPRTPLTGGSFDNTFGGASNLESQIIVNNNGTIDYWTFVDGGLNSTATLENWYLPTTTSIGASYFVKATVTATGGSGTSTGLGFGTYTSLSSSTIYSVLRSTAGSGSKTFRIDISTVSNDTGIVSTGSFTLSLTQ